MVGLDDISCSFSDGCYAPDGKHCESYLSQMDDLQFQLDFTVFNLTSKFYTFDRLNYATGNSYCQVAIASLPDKQGIYILGDPFFRAFTTTFDYDDNKMKVGINPNAASYVTIYTVMTNWAKFGIVVACLFVLGLLATAAYFIYKKCKRDRHTAKQTAQYYIVKELW